MSDNYAPVSISSIREKVSHKTLIESEKQAAIMMAEIRLRKIREQLHVSQKNLADRMNVTQSYISKLENSEDVMRSKIREYVQALGGTAEIVVRFNEGETLCMPL